eukprot:4448255-Alexandrium_andersonii.AAC.1
MLGVPLDDGVQRRERRGSPRSGLAQTVGSPDARPRRGALRARHSWPRPGRNIADTQGRAPARHALASRGHDLNVADA